MYRIPTSIHVFTLHNSVIRGQAEMADAEEIKGKTPMHMHTQTCMHACMHARKHARMHACTHTHKMEINNEDTNNFMS